MKALQKDEKAGEKRSIALPGQEISEEEFLRSVKEAEEGPFMTVEEAMSDFEEWFKAREKR